MSEITKGFDFSKYYVMYHPKRTAADLIYEEANRLWTPTIGQRVRLTERARTQRYYGDIDWELVRARFESVGTIIAVSSSICNVTYAEVNWDRIAVNYPVPARLVLAADLELVNPND